MSVLTMARRAVMMAGVNKGINWLYNSRPDIVERAIGQRRYAYRGDSRSSYRPASRPSAIAGEPLEYSSPANRGRRRSRRSNPLRGMAMLVPVLVVGGLLMQRKRPA